LNVKEREACSAAERQGFAVTHGNGSRKERKGSPLLNTLRQRADALAQPLIWVERPSLRERGSSSNMYYNRTADGDHPPLPFQAPDDAKCCIDFSPLRLPDAHTVQHVCDRAMSVASNVVFPFRSSAGAAVAITHPTPATPTLTAEAPTTELQLVPNTLDDLMKRPIWGLMPCIVRFEWTSPTPELMTPEVYSEQLKVCKTLAAKLAREFSTGQNAL
jgi:hypothetical protein